MLEIEQQYVAVSVICGCYKVFVVFSYFRFYDSIEVGGGRERVIVTQLVDF